MAELNFSTIVKRSIQGFFSLAFVQLISSILVFILAGIVEARTFGVFIVVSASISFLTYFSDIGLAAALIQKKEKVTDNDLKTTFTIQQILVISIVLLGFLAVPFVSDFYDLDSQGTLLFQALLVSFFFSSLKTIPSITLIRSIRFFKISLVQVLETLVFNSVAVFFALKGFGTTSFTYAVLGRSVIGLCAIYLIAPWRISIGISRESLRKLLSYGVPIQANSILALVKDDLLTIVLGKILPLAQVGYIGFAQKSAFMPLRLLMDKIIQVTFPAFSRLQDDKPGLRLAVEKTIFGLSFFVFPATIGIAIVAPFAIEVIPKYQRWEAAIPSLTFFAINAVFSSISTPLTNILNAIGKVRITFYFMLFWTAATWILTLILIQVMGFLGVSVASAAIATSAIVVVFVVRKFIAFDIFKPISIPFIASAIMGLVLYFVSPLLIKDISTLLLGVLLGGVVYFGVLFAVAKETIKSNFLTLLKHLRYSS